ncbi:Integral membrane protein YggT, involved in response to extracytoplasmic stress (osmotic shock) [plant metagenome]|uniref:Integral membrane protein YggT, involved in response to extracytoplasmic stress (Osmotic shock) n=1 Tax=plant metagenome TaxID=1297885 RepID=A0A484QJU0_9ZZZZ
MFGDIIRFLLEIAFTLLGAALLARAWFIAVRMHPFHPVVQSINQATNWLVMPLRKILPNTGRIDWACLLAAWLVALVYLVLSWLVSTGSMVPVQLLPAALGAALLTVARWSLNLVLWLTLLQVVLSWVNPAAPMMGLLRTLTAPLLDPLRRILPNMGGIDLSPLALLIIAQVLMMVLARISYGIFGV